MSFRKAFTREALEAEYTLGLTSLHHQAVTHKETGEPGSFRFDRDLGLYTDYQSQKDTFKAAIKNPELLVEALARTLHQASCDKCAKERKDHHGS